MFAIQPPQKQSSGSETGKSTHCCTPNVLPCRIHHDGPVEALDRYWIPVSEEKDKNTQTAYFRGRKLRGRHVAIPEGYEGIVVTPTDRVMPSNQKGTDLGTDDIEAEQEEPVKILEKQATFNEFMVWGHEEVPAADDAFVKGVKEWLKLAEAIHSPLSGEKKTST